MPVQQLAPILNVSSIVESQNWFAALRWERGVTWPHGSPDPNLGEYHD